MIVEPQELLLLTNGIEPSKALTGWADVVGKLSPVLIGLAGFWIARSQWVIARANLRVSLHDIRKETKQKIDEILSKSEVTDKAKLLRDLEAVNVDIRRVFGGRAARSCNRLLRFLKGLEDPVIRRIWSREFMGENLGDSEIKARIKELEESLEKEMRLS